MGRRKPSPSIRRSVFRTLLDQQYDDAIRYRLHRSVKSSVDWVQRLCLEKVLPIHTGCVNCICWNEKGDKLLSGSDDQHLIITHPYSYKVMSDYKTSHRANIFSAKFLPRTGDTGIVSCSGDGMILHTDLLRTEDTHNNIFNCHVGTTYEIATIPDEANVFLSCGEDCTVRFFDLRTKQRCSKSKCTDDVMILSQRPVTALCVNSAFPYQLAIGCSDSTVRLYDRRMLSVGGGDGVKPFDYYRAPGMEGRFYRITSLSFSPRGEDILVSYSSEHLYLFSLQSKHTTTLSPNYTMEDLDSSCDSASSVNSTPVVPVRRLRLRGDWSDTGPDARPQNDTTPGGASQARPTLHGTLMQRMTDVLSRMLNDPATRAALSQGGEDSFPEAEENQSSQSEPSTQEMQERVPSPTLGNSPMEVDPQEGSSSNQYVEGSASNEEPLDLPLPSFSSTYSTFVKPPSEEAQPTEETPEETSEVAPMDTTSESTPSTSSGIKSHLSELTQMHHGFVEKNGVRPMVNLTYSDVGPTSSSISVFVDEDRNSSGTPDEEIPQLPDPIEPQVEASPSQPEPEMLETSIFPPDLNDVDFPDPDDYFNASLGTECPVRSMQARLVHPIEKHMDDAITNANTQGENEGCDDSVKSKKFNFKQSYTGHRNSRTMIKEATFWGDDYVISGSDCGHIFMWDKESGKLKMLLAADHHVVNCVQPHPYLPLLASSGIDYDVKLWAPKNEDDAFDQAMADELMERNAIMLEETRDTITVPASFMIRMLACLNHIRRGARGRLFQRRESSANSD